MYSKNEYADFVCLCGHDTVNKCVCFKEVCLTMPDDFIEIGDNLYDKIL
jgi:hypothetical protein